MDVAPWRESLLTQQSRVYRLVFRMKRGLIMDKEIDLMVRQALQFINRCRVFKFNGELFPLTLERS